MRSRTNLNSIRKQARHLMKTTKGYINFGRPSGEGVMSKNDIVVEIQRMLNKASKNLRKNEENSFDHHIHNVFKKSSKGKTQLLLKLAENKLTPEDLNSFLTEQRAKQQTKNSSSADHDQHTSNGSNDSESSSSDENDSNNIGSYGVSNIAHGSSENNSAGQDKPSDNQRTAVQNDDEGGWKQNN